MNAPLRDSLVEWIDAIEWSAAEVALADRLAASITGSHVEAVVMMAAAVLVARRARTLGGQADIAALEDEFAALIRHVHDDMARRLKRPDPRPVTPARPVLRVVGGRDA